jgi:hypothetical protein
VVNGIGKQGAMAGYGSSNYQYAYEYSDSYTSDEPVVESDQSSVISDQRDQGAS